MAIKRFNGSERRAYVRLEKSLSVRLKVTGNPSNKNFYGNDEKYQPGWDLFGDSTKTRNTA